MEKRVLLAVAISFGVIFMWSMLFPQPVPNRPQPPFQGTPTPGPERDIFREESAPAKTPLSSPEADVVTPEVEVDALAPDAALVEEGAPIFIGNELLEMSFSSPSGKLRSVKLSGFREEEVDVQNLKRRAEKMRGSEKDKLTALLGVSLARKGEIEEQRDLVQSSSGEAKIKAEEELKRLLSLEMVPSQPWPSLGVPLAIREVKGLYLKGSSVEKVDSRQAVISYPLDMGFTLKETIKVGEGYIIDVDLAWENSTQEPQSWASARGYQMEWGGGIGLTQMADQYGGKFQGPASRVDWKIEKKNDQGLISEIKKNEGNPIAKYGKVQWMAMRGKYFMMALIPEAGTAGTWYVGDPEHGTGVALLMEGVTVPPGETLHQKIELFMGPKDYDLVLRQPFATQRLGLEKAVDLSYYAVFEDISLLILRLLEGFHKVTHDYGLSIILLTVLIKILFFPLSFKSISSMRKMQELQPAMQKLKYQYRNEPKRFQQETSKLYRKHKVNPVAGCLPMVVQMPVFITLYGTLSTSIRLRGQPFLKTWVRDLSSPDTVGHFPEGFPVLGGMPINILPLIMGVGMVIQQKLTAPPAVTEEQIQQQKIMMFMPLMFLFICYSMPSGLVLYWLTQTTLSLAEQAIVKKLRPLKVIEVEPAKKGNAKP